ncbi:MAG: hypothetical protein ACXQTE_02805 [Methanosarcinaceae archaeon]
MNGGERRLIEFCRKNGIECHRIEKGKGRTPDFDLFAQRDRIIVEVKDFVDNDDESKAVESYNSDGYAVWGSSAPGKRFVQKIKKAVTQLKPIQTDPVPQVLIIVDTRTPLVSVVDPYEIAVAMYGHQTLSHDEAGRSAQRFGRKAHMTKTTSTRISAIGVLSEDLHLDLYLNHYAAMPLLQHQLLTHERVNTYRLATAPERGFSNWVKCETSRE